MGNPAKEETIIVFIIALFFSIWSYLKISGKTIKSIFEDIL